MRALHPYRKTVFVAGAGFMAALMTAVLLQQPLLLLLPFATLLLAALVRHTIIIWLLLLGSIAFSAEIQVTESLGTDLPDEALMLLVSFAAVLYFIYRKGAGLARIFQEQLVLLLIVQWLWHIICSVFSADILISLKYCIAKTWYYIPFVLLPCHLLTDKKSMQRAAAFLWMPLLIIVPIILVRHAQQGFLFDGINGAVTPFFRNHVNYAAFLVCMLPVIFFTRRFCPHQKQRHLLMVVLAILGIALFFSFSRGAWLALAGGALAGWCVRRKLILWLIALSGIAAITLVLWLSQNNRYLNYHHNYKKTIYHANFADHMVATFQNQDMSNAERFHRWIAGLRMSGEYPLTGFGPATFYDHYKPYTVSYFRTWVSANEEHSTVHNYFLLLLVEQGVPGLLFFVILITAFFATAQRSYHRLINTGNHVFEAAVVMCCTIVFAMILILNLLSDLVETDKVGSLYYLCIGVLLAVKLRTGNATAKNGSD
jgi:O-antigen ligase